MLTTLDGPAKDAPVKVEQTRVDTVVDVLKNKLGRQPTPKEVADMLETLDAPAKAEPVKVEQARVNTVVDVLKN